MNTIKTNGREELRTQFPHSDEEQCLKARLTRFESCLAKGQNLQGKQ